MKRFFLLLLVFSGILSHGPTAFAQNNEDYYKKDTLRGQERKSTIVIPDTEERNPPAVRDGKDRLPLSITERLRLGGSFGLNLGTFININLSPMAGLNLTNNLLVGAGPTYMMTSYRSYIGGPSRRVTNSSYGGRIFLMYNTPLPIITLQAEYEGLNVRYYNNFESRFERTWLGSPLIGAAYTQPLGGRFTHSIHMTALYNLSYDSQLNPTSGRNISPYGSPFVFRLTFL